MTIIEGDSFWLLWIIQLLFDVIILLTIILQKPARKERSGPNDSPPDPINWLEGTMDGTNPRNPGKGNPSGPDTDRFGWERQERS